MTKEKNYFSLSALAKKITSLSFLIEKNRIFKEPNENLGIELEKSIEVFCVEAKERGIEVPEEKERLFEFIKQLSLKTLKKTKD